MKNTIVLRYFLVFVAIILGMLALVTPKVVNEERHFSADAAFEDILEIAETGTLGWWDKKQAKKALEKDMEAAPVTEDNSEEVVEEEVMNEVKEEKTE